MLRVNVDNADVRGPALGESRWYAVFAAKRVGARELAMGNVL